jgi:hypothetical protein
MDELFEVHGRPEHTYSTTDNSHKTDPTASSSSVPHRIAVLALCAQMLIGCGGGVTDSGATEPETVSAASYTWPATYTCTHFVDAVTGADTHSGSSPETAWASADRAAAHTRGPLARPGDTLCFQRGQRFVVTNGQLGSPGTATAPMTIGAYGDPSQPAPRLSPAIRIDNQPDWVNLGNGVYYWPTSHPHWNVSGLWRGGVWQRPATDSTLRDGDWYYEKNGGLYLRTSSAPATAGALYLDVRYAVFGVHGLRYIAFRDLTFEYTGTAIAGRPTVRGGSPRAIAYLLVKNCRFEHLTSGVTLTSETVNGTAYENHHIEIAGNQFDDIRFAVTLAAAGNGPERHRYVTIADNAVRNVTVNGRYVVHDKIPDIQAIRMQNPSDTRIVGNRVEQGLRQEQGLVSADGDVLVTNGIDLYRHPAAVFARVRVERNYVRDLDYGITLGSGVQSAMHKVTVTNNIVANCAVGIKVNGFGTANAYRARFNTLFRNGINLYVVGNPVVVNNFSVEPRDYHVVIAGKGSVVDYNAYAPDGRFLFYNRFQSKLNRQFKTLRAFKAARHYKHSYDSHSLAAPAAGMVNPAPQAPEDFRLTDGSVARGRGLASGLEDGDFGGRSRPAESAPDIGAWARYPSDG